MKKCKKCEIEKNIDAFGKHNGMSSGILNLCKVCKSIYDKKRYESNRMSVLARVGEYARKNSEKINKYLTEYNNGNGSYDLKKKSNCRECRTDKDLCIHHIDNNGQRLPRDQRNNTLSNLEVICRSCHMRLHRTVKFH